MLAAVLQHAVRFLGPYVNDFINDFTKNREQSKENARQFKGQEMRSKKCPYCGSTLTMPIKEFTSILHMRKCLHCKKEF